MPKPVPRGPRIGRARDPDIDVRVLAAAARQLSNAGYEAMSVSAVAQEAETTRQAVYRRWPTKASLAAAALIAADAGLDAGLTETRAAAPEGGVTRKPPTYTGRQDPLGDLAAELANFQHGVSRPGRLSLVGTMLQDSTEPVVRSRYRAQVVDPRRSRIRAILDDAQRQGLIDDDADLEVAVTMCTGSWYGRALAEDRPPPDWPTRVAALVWRALGGRVTF